MQETKSQEVIWKENIFSQYRAEFDEAFYGIERARKANEGAIRDNLTQLLKKLSNLQTVLEKND